MTCRGGDSLHKLLLRGGYIRRASGIRLFALDVAVLRKVSAIVRQEMDAPGPSKPCCPSCSPPSCGSEVAAGRVTQPVKESCFTCRIARTVSLGLAQPMKSDHSLAADLLRSYRQLPVNLYQIQTKFKMKFVRASA